MRLNEALHPLLTPVHVRTLKDFRIESVAQLLAKEPESLAGILRISYSQVRTNILVGDRGSIHLLTH